MQVLRIASVLAPSVVPASVSVLVLALLLLCMGCSADTSDLPTDVGLGLPDLLLTADTSNERDVSSEDASAEPDISTEPVDVPVATDTPKPDAGPVSACFQCPAEQPHCLIVNSDALGCVACLADTHCTSGDECSSNHDCSPPPPPSPSHKDVEWLCQAGVCWGKDGRCLPDEVPCKDAAECVTLESIFGYPPLDEDKDPGGWCACPDGTCPDEQTCGPGTLAILAALVPDDANAPNTCSK